MPTEGAHPSSYHVFTGSCK